MTKLNFNSKQALAISMATAAKDQILDELSEIVVQLHTAELIFERTGELKRANDELARLKKMGATFTEYEKQTAAELSAARVEFELKAPSLNQRDAPGWKDRRGELYSNFEAARSNANRAGADRRDNNVRKIQLEKDIARLEREIAMLKELEAPGELPAVLAIYEFAARNS